MSKQTVPGTDVTYHLVSFDKNGNERMENGHMESDTISAELANAASTYTDVFMLSHGWKGDVPSAIEQYDRWIATMDAQVGDREEVRKKLPSFKPFIVGFHWPSQPWGEEELSAAGDSFDASTKFSVGTLVDRYADRIADTPAARAALRIIIESAVKDIEPAVMSQEVVQAYLALDREADLGSGGAAASPGDDRERFDPSQAYDDAKNDPDEYGAISADGILSPLRQLSFWAMKKRGKNIGQTAGHSLLRSMQTAVNTRPVRFHLMGHSFGCIVISATLQGPKGAAGAVRADSVLLAQGALSLWSYCSSIPSSPGKPGYFNQIFTKGVVKGPFLTTQSRFDTANGKFYPLGAGLAGQDDYDANRIDNKLPKYGAVGSFGVRGAGPNVVDLKMLKPTEPYSFANGTVYNLNGDDFIRHGAGMSGAHSDIAQPAVAHAFWSAVLSTL